jgi:hypothetical protein
MPQTNNSQSSTSGGFVTEHDLATDTNNRITEVSDPSASRRSLPVVPVTRDLGCKPEVVKSPMTPSRQLALAQRAVAARRARRGT